MLIVISEALGACQQVRAAASARNNAASVKNTAQETLPQCKDNGKFLPQQCDETTNECWCVNNAGKVESQRKSVQSLDQDIGCCEYIGIFNLYFPSSVSSSDCLL